MPADTPEQFEYNGQLYVVSEMLGHTASTGHLGHEEQWIVRAIPVQLADTQTFDLTFDPATGWRITPTDGEDQVIEQSAENGQAAPGHRLSFAGIGHAGPDLAEQSRTILRDELGDHGTPVECSHRGPDVIQSTAPPFLLCPECRRPPHG